VLPATIYGTKIKSVGNEGFQYQCEISYNYKVGDEYYSGLFYQLVPNESDGMKYLESFPKDKEIFVRADPDNPETSVLDVDSRDDESLKHIFSI
jgi:hypothetical protein